MTESLKDPERLADSAEDALLRNILEAGRGELANADQLAIVAAKLGTVLAATGVGTSAALGAAGTTKVAAGIASSAVAKMIGIVGVGGLLTVAAIHLATPSPMGSPVQGVDTNVAPARPSNVVQPGSVVSPTPGSVHVEPETNPTSRPGASRRSAPSSATPRASSPGPAKPESEVKLLERAQDALRADPTRALAICDEHGRRFPDGLLVQEREVIAIDALMRLNRSGEAETRSRRFATAHPSSSHLRRIELLLGKDL